MLIGNLLLVLICGGSYCFPSEHLWENFEASKGKKQYGYENRWRRRGTDWHRSPLRNANSRYRNYGSNNAFNRMLSTPSRSSRLTRTYASQPSSYRSNFPYENPMYVPTSFQTLDNLRGEGSSNNQNTNNYNQYTGNYNPSSNNYNSNYNQYSNTYDPNVNQNYQNSYNQQYNNQNNQNSNYNQQYNQNNNQQYNNNNPNSQNMNNNQYNNNPNSNNRNVQSMNLGTSTSCDDWHSQAHKKDGIFTVSAAGRQIEVFCEFQLDGYNWVVLQRRIDGSIKFYRNWSSFENGFGNKTQEFWLGLKHMHLLLASYQRPVLRFDFEDFAGNTAHAEYSFFFIDDERSLYQMRVDGYSGTAGDSFSYHNRAYFSTSDRDNDQDLRHLAVDYQGPWWYNNGAYSNLNGPYLSPGSNTNSTGIFWYQWKRGYESLKSASMKIRPGY